MENVIDFTSGNIPEKNTDKSEKVEITEIIVDGEVVDTVPESSEEPKEYTHVRSPELKKRAEKIFMTAVSLLGTAAAALAAVTGVFGEKPAAALYEKYSAGFGGVFSGELLINCGCLAAEFILGFFAFGDLLVWLVPLFLGLGTGLTFVSFWQPSLLPSAAAVLLCGSFGAAFSSEFSVMLRDFSGGRSVRTEDFPAAAYSARFIVLLVGMLLSAAYEGIISEFVLK